MRTLPFCISQIEIFKNIAFHKKYKKPGALSKKEAAEVINFDFAKPDTKKFILSKKLLLILKIRRKIMFSIPARLIDR